MISISIKDLRQNLSKVGDAVNAGQSFTIFRRSRPIGKFVPLMNLRESNLKNIEEVNEFEDEEEWTTIADFTEGGTKSGAPIEDVIAALKKLNKNG